MRYQASVMASHLGAHVIGEVPAMSVTQAEAFFGVGKACTQAPPIILRWLAVVKQLSGLLDRLVDRGRSVSVIEHRVKDASP